MGGLNTPYFIFFAAADFFNKGVEAAKEHFKADENEAKQYDNFIHAKLCMPVVNICLALELSFKGLLKHAGGKPWGHNILELYDALDLDLRARIVDHYRSHDHFKKFVAIRLASGVGHSTFSFFYGFPDNESGIRQLLEVHKEHFVDFRYLFEYDDSTEVMIHFRELSNLTVSALFILGETQKVKVELMKPSAPIT